MTDVTTNMERWDAFGFDQARYDRWIALCDLYTRWLSTRASGLENIPESGPVLLVSNHVGYRLLDAMCTQAVIRRDHPAERVVRPLYHIGLEKKLFFGHLVNHYMGAVLGHPHNAEYLLGRGWAVLTFPEGGHSTSKTFSERDQLCPPEQFGKGWARLALSAGVPVVPVAAAGFESAIPTLYLSTLLGRLWLSNSAPYPVSPQSLITLSIPTLNWMAPFPVRTRITFGAPRLPQDVEGPTLESRAEALWKDVYHEIGTSLADHRARREE